jgi:hypothetical protein
MVNVHRVPSTTVPQHKQAPTAFQPLTNQQGSRPAQGLKLPTHTSIETHINDHKWQHNLQTTNMW